MLTSFRFPLRILSASLLFAMGGCALTLPATMTAQSESVASPGSRGSAQASMPRQEGQADAERHYLVAKYWLGQQRFSEALHSLNRAIEKDASHVEALNARASVKVSLADFDGARMDLGTALRLAPDRVHLHYNSALLHRMRGDLDLAVAALRAAFALDPSHEGVLAALESMDRSPAVARQPVEAGLQVVRIDAGSSVAAATVATPLDAAPMTATRTADTVAQTASKTPGTVASAAAAPVTTVVVIKDAAALPSSPSVRAETQGSATEAQSSFDRGDHTQHAALIRVPESAFEPSPSAPGSVREFPSALARSEISVLDLESTTPIAWAPVAHKPLDPALPASYEVRVIGATVEEGTASHRVPSILAIRHAPIEAARIDIANGNGINGMARALRGQLRAVGVQVATISNWTHFHQPVTRVLYREGFEQAARELAQRMPVQVELVAAERLPRADRDVMVVLGRDMRGYRATASGWENMAQMADIPAA